jgi:exodeoxyribonuclease V alpha subunit
MAGEQERLEGELVGFQFRAEDRGFAVGKLRQGSADVTVVGAIGHVLEGQHVQVQGRWTTHAQFGRQFQVERVLVEDPRTIHGLEKYLGSGAIKGLGPGFAKRVVERFGLDTLRVIEEDPERLLQVEGIGRKRLTDIVSHYVRDRRDREVMATLRGWGIGQGLATRIVERFGGDALQIVTRHPFRLLEVRGVGFKTADALAAEHGIAKDAPERIEAALQYVLEEAASQQGHTFVPEHSLLARAQDLEVPMAPALAGIDRLVSMGRLFRAPSLDPTQRPVALPGLAREELIVAHRLLELQKTPRPEGPDAREITDRLGLVLNAEQQHAIRLALREGVTIITGGPGTGKTTIVRALTALADARTWALAAPTGRASRRLAETTGRDAKTIHRLLEFNPGTGRFVRNASNPIEARAVLVDEASMVDVPLLAALLEAIPRSARLVLVGDADQLPSVGPGAVLRDVIRAGTIPVATLRDVYRQAADSGIVEAAYAINHGEMPCGGERDESVDDFFVVGRNEAPETQKALLEIVGRRLPAKGFDPLRDVQVLTPMHAGPLGTGALNDALQDLLNPNGRQIVRGGKRIRVGDRVLQVRNDYDNDIFNGDIGRVVSVGDEDLVIDFDGRTVALVGKQLDDVELAYAISIHKSQGSEYPAVVVAIHRSHRIMLRRNLLYTAVTRARRFCCLVGSPWAIGFASKQQGGDERWTRLGELLLEQ